MLSCPDSESGHKLALLHGAPFWRVFSGREENLKTREGDKSRREWGRGAGDRSMFISRRQVAEEVGSEGGKFLWGPV